jgi:hypothetical protein
LISLTYTLIYSARTDLDADIPADIPGNTIRDLADRLVKEARRAEEARLRLELSERARSTLEAELADERRRREETERERDELRQELEALKLEVLRESCEERSESPESPGPVDSLPTPAKRLRRPQSVRIAKLRGAGGGGCSEDSSSPGCHRGKRTRE